MLLTQKQAADKLGVCIATITRRIKDGSINAVRLGHRTIRIEESELEKFVERGRLPRAEQ